MQINHGQGASILLFLLSSVLASAQVASWDMGKARIHQQTSEGTAPTVAEAWGVWVYVEVSLEEAPTATISGGGVVGSLALPREGDSFELNREYLSEAAMNLEFPSNSTYTITLSGGSLGPVTQQLVIGAADYSAVPTLMTGELARNRSLDSTQNHLLRWRTPSAGVDAIFLEVGDDGDEWELGGSETSFHFPANTMTPGQCADALLVFDNYTEVSGSGGFGVDGYFSHASATRFGLSAVMTLTPQAIVGAWQFGNGAPGASGVLLFQANGIYFHAEDIDSTEPWESDGMERGTYTWNSVSGAFSATTLVDTNGEIGLSHPSAPMTMVVIGDSLMITEGGDSFALSRVGYSATNALQGGWMLCDNKGMITACLVFLSNNKYFHMEVFSADGSNGNDDINGITGMERASYSFNSGTGRLDATLIVPNDPDTNLQYGLSDPIIGYDEMVFLSQRVLTIDDTGGVDEPGELHRVSNAILDSPATTETLLDEALADAGLAGGEADPLAVPFADGVPNLLKYAFNMDMSGPDPSLMTPDGDSGLPGGGIVEADGQSYWRVEYVRRVGSGLLYTPKKSTTLTPGSFVPLSGEQAVTPIDAEWERVTVDEPCDPATTSKCFSHVEVALP